MVLIRNTFRLVHVSVDAAGCQEFTRSGLSSEDVLKLLLRMYINGVFQSPKSVISYSFSLKQRIDGFDEGVFVVKIGRGQYVIQIISRYEVSARNGFLIKYMEDDNCQ